MAILGCFSQIGLWFVGGAGSGLLSILVPARCWWLENIVYIFLAFDSGGGSRVLFFFAAVLLWGLMVWLLESFYGFVFHLLNFYTG